jgi:imidazolonepropionase-like amidohydrolase
LRAGYTAMADLSISGRVSLAVRDAIEAGLFAGPRVSSSGRALTTRQGLDDWYPRWIGVPETSIGVLVRNVAEGIEEVRGQVKDGVNFVKLAMDGDAMNPATGMIAGFNQEETSALVTEIHRLGKKAVCHARGAEAVRYSARAGADVILHASWMDDEGLELVVKNRCALIPTLSLIVNNIDFTQPTDACYPAFPDAHKRELESAVKALGKAREARVPFWWARTAASRSRPMANGMRANLSTTSNTWDFRRPRRCAARPRATLFCSRRAVRSGAWSRAASPT